MSLFLGLWKLAAATFRPVSLPLSALRGIGWPSVSALSGPDADSASGGFFGPLRPRNSPASILGASGSILATLAAMLPRVAPILAASMRAVSMLALSPSLAPSVGSAEGCAGRPAPEHFGPRAALVEVLRVSPEPAGVEPEVEAGSVMSPVMANRSARASDPREAVAQVRAVAHARMRAAIRHFQGLARVPLRPTTEAGS